MENSKFKEILGTSKIGSLLGSVGLIVGVGYGLKSQKPIGTTVLFALGFGLLGKIVGNQISKFYEQ